MTIIGKSRPFSYCYYRGLYNRMIRFHSVGPRMSSTKSVAKARKKTPLKDLGVRSELSEFLNARFSQLNGSSDEFHILRTAHHEGRFEDRWPCISTGGLFEHPTIIERFAEAVPPNEMTPAFARKLLLTHGKANNLIDEEKAWLNDVKSFSDQMKKVGAKEIFDPNLDVAHASITEQPKSGIKKTQPVIEPASLLELSEDLGVEDESTTNDENDGIEGRIKADNELEFEPVQVMGVNIEDVPSESVSFYLESKKGTKNLPNVIKPKKSRSKAVKKDEGSQKTKRDSHKLNSFFNNDLEAYVNACIFTGMIDKAMKTLKFYFFIHQQSPDEMIYKVNNINIYSTLMHAVAKKGKFGPLRELFHQLTSNGLKPSLQCYAACLECLSRQDVLDFDLGQHIISDLQRDGFKEEDIFNECIFRKDERQSVLKALKILKPNFEPKPLEPEVKYQGPLLEKLNQRLDLNKMIDANPYFGVVSNEHLLKQMEIQTDREAQDHFKVSSVIKQNKGKIQNEKMEKYLEIWRKSLLKGFKRKLFFYENQKKFDNRMSLYPYLKLFPPEVYVDIMLEEAIKLATDSETFSPSLSFLCFRMGNRIYYKYIIQDKQDAHITKKMIRIYHDYIELYNQPNNETLNHRVLWQKLQVKHIDGPSLDIPNKFWPVHVLKGIGRILFDIVLYDLKIDNSQSKTQSPHPVPAFYTVYRNYSYVTKEEVKPHPRTMKLFQSLMSSELTFDAVALPMLVPPVPWISLNVGSNLIASTKLIRLPDSVNKIGHNDLVSSKSLNSIFDGLNTLSACPWIINKPVLDLIIEIFNKKGNKKLDIPPPSSECPPLPKLTNEMTGQQRSRIQRMRIKLKQQKSEMHGLWCNELYKLSIANHFRDEVFWFPHNMDFRGRTYPCPPHFNHLGGDVTRSLLLFAKGKKLGPKGLDWLKIHLVNLTGFRKRFSNAERLAFANENLDNILDSADHPMDGNGWWQTSDEPWQTLACCMEIAKAIRSENPEEFVSHYPVHQDGSCNGLQHYAALGRDCAGSESVNLSPSDRPQDVYSDVCELVERERVKDAENGILIAQKLEGFIRRKVIKQTIMTTVYGVTRYGAKFQILKQLKDLQDFDSEFIWQACVYLTDKTFLCLAEMFTATKDIQMWLTLCAHHISTVSMSPVEWITPLGLPVIQPYHKMSTLQRWGVSLTNMSNFEKPNSVKQKNAFPPNFIHSLDSTHMLLTALYCLRAGITYVSVHDCFWTHPASVEIMNKICREQFVALHSQPILEDLSKHLLQKFCPTSRSIDLKEDPNKRLLHSVLCNVPSKGNFELEKILESTYFFS